MLTLLANLALLTSSPSVPSAGFGSPQTTQSPATQAPATQTPGTQTPVEAKALTALFAALRAKSIDPVRAYLAPATRVGDLPATSTVQVLTELLKRSVVPEQIDLVRQAPEGANVRYVYRLTRGGVPKEYDFLLGADGRFLEINLARASVKRIGAEIDPAKLVLPDRIDASFRLVDGLILVTAEVDGRRGEFVFDTGAPTVRLNGALFAPPKGQTTLGGGGSRGVNGEVAAASFHHVERFDWQGLRFGDLDLATFDFSAIEARLGKRRVLGLIGASVLRSYALTLDYRARRLSLVKPTSAPTPDARTFPLRFRGHLPTAEFTIGTQRLLLGIDTGAQANLVDPRFEAAIKPTLEKPRQDRLLGVEGKSISILSGLVPETRIGGVVFPDARTAFAPAPQISATFGEASLDGLVGYPILSRYRTTIDYVHATIHFAP